MKIGKLKEDNNATCVNRKFLVLDKVKILKLWIIPAVFVFYCLSVFVPWVPRSWQPPCNNSWVLALHDAFVNSADFGSDVVFTFGPYGFLYFGSTPQTYALTVIGWATLAAGYCVAVWKALNMSGLPSWGKLIGALLVTGITASVDVVDAQIFAFVAFASAAWILNRPKDIPSNAIVGLSLALASMVKFSWFIAIFPCVAAITFIGMILKHRCASVGIIYALSCIALWLAADQSISSIGIYLSSSLEITGGYAESMQLEHPWGVSNVWAYIIIASFLLSLSAYELFPKRALPAIALLGSLALILLIGFKAGYVRHDHHEVVSSALLVSIGILLFYILSNRVLISIASAAALILYGLSTNLHEENPSFESRFAKTYQLRGMWDFFRFITGKVDPDQCYAADMESIAKNHPFNLPSGTIDLYPWGGIDIMHAKHLQVTQRPVFESYTAYTSHLARINRNFLTSVSAPDQLLFAVRSLDQRFPAMDDGLSWPVILTHYEVQSKQGEYLLMRRRNFPSNHVLSAIEELDLQADTLVALPEARAVWMEIDLPLTTKGKLLKQLYKPAILIMVARFEDGTTHAYRLIPNVAAAGFLISPVISNSTSFEVLHANLGDARLSQLRPQAIAITGTEDFKTHYDFQRAKIRFSSLELSD